MKLRTLLLASSCLVSSLFPAIVLSQSALAPPLPPLNLSNTGLQLPGKFVWFDLATPDLPKLKSFYSRVFGWRYQNSLSRDDSYTLVLNQGKPVAGMFHFQPPSGERDGATWIVLMSVEDTDRAVQLATLNRGAVEIKPSHISGRGKHALLKDPAGALFGVLRSESGDPLDQEVPVGGFFWVDLFTREPEVMTSFYTKLAPYETERREVADGFYRTLLSAGGLMRAGMVKVDEEANRSAWVPYVRVDNVEATLKKAVDAGGFAIIPPDPVILDGKLAVFVDPNGGVIGIVEWDYDREAGQ